mgnify:CR=1 FL=1
MTDAAILAAAIAYRAKHGMWPLACDLAADGVCADHVAEQAFRRLARTGKLPFWSQRNRDNDAFRARSAKDQKMRIKTIAAAQLAKARRSTLLTEAEWSALMASTGRDYGRRYRPRVMVDHE